mgnify:FL=1
MQAFDLLVRAGLDLTTLSIVSKRLKLFSISDKYSADIFREFNAGIIRYMLPKPADHIEETLDFINDSRRGMREGWNLVLAITEKTSGEFLGCCGLHGEGRHRTPELGIWIKKSAHGNKYGLEAIHTLASWTFKHIDVDYLIYPVDRANIPSRRIPESMGGIVFEEKQVKTARGGYLDEICYNLSIENFTLISNTKLG